MIRKIRKRDGKVVDFNPIKITDAIWKAAQAVGGKDHKKAAELTDKVLERLEKKLKKGGRFLQFMNRLWVFLMQMKTEKCCLKNMAFLSAACVTSCLLGQ